MFLGLPLGTSLLTWLFWRSIVFTIFWGSIRLWGSIVFNGRRSIIIVHVTITITCFILKLRWWLGVWTYLCVVFTSRITTGASECTISVALLVWLWRLTGFTRLSHPQA